MGVNDDDNQNSVFRKFYSNNDLAEMFLHLHPGVTPPNTYQREGNHIDYIFITLGLIPTLKSVGFLLLNIPFMSDHGAILAVFDEEILFKGEMNNPVDSASHNLIAGNPACRDRYEAFDQIIAESMLGAEKTCRRQKTGHIWSIKLAHAARITYYWKTRKSDSFNGREPSQALLKLGNNLNITFSILNKNEIASKLTAARKELTGAPKTQQHYAMSILRKRHRFKPH
eukprot:8595141-Ditylum_brightwellii.AAC.1